MQTILLQLDPEDNTNFLPTLKSIVKGKANVKVTNLRVESAYEVVAKAKGLGVSLVATTSGKVLQSLLGLTRSKLPSTNDYAGSIFEKAGIEFLILPPLEHLVTINYGKFLYERYLSKFINRSSWLQLPVFNWEMFSPEKAERMFSLLSGATFCALDIETVQEDRAITCLGLAIATVDPKTKIFSVDTFVIPFTDIYNVTVARRVCASSCPKVLQNGKYDIAYLLRYNCPIVNYAFDTINLFHSWYSELPKDLGFIAAFMLRKWQYWKDEGASGPGTYEYYQYNAKDCFGTACILVAMIQELPEYAWQNFLLEFPVVFPCILAEHTGIKIDLPAMQAMNDSLENFFTEERRKLGVMVAAPDFNPGSPKQVQMLWDILGSSDIKGTGKIQMDKVASRHPLNARIVLAIKLYKEAKKAASTYTDVEKAWNGRCYYSLNPHATDTGRLASRESAFWCGWQIQNIPRDKKSLRVKSAFIADSGYYFGEADGEQAEARTTAYLSGDTNLIAAVEGTQDYHGLNASKFFGVPYEDIIGPDGEQLDKDLRDLAKRTNHGANYNMGAQVMLDTMGINNVIRARRLLNLPPQMPLIKVTEYLLSCFAKTYPVVKNDFQKKIIGDILSTGFLTGPTGWSRRCFGSPNKNKLDLNAVVAHGPQSLNAMILNKAWIRVFNEVWALNQKDFKLVAQIHDSILFQYRQGREDLAYAVKKCMEIPIVVTDIFNIKRTLLVPIALKGEATSWSDLKKMS